MSMGWLDAKTVHHAFRNGSLKVLLFKGFGGAMILNYTNRCRRLSFDPERENRNALQDTCGIGKIDLEALLGADFM
jgi:hypothetical protein